MKPLKIKIKSRPSVEAMVKKFFANTSTDVVSLTDAFRNWGRDTEDEAKNKQWLSNKLPHMKYYDLVVPIYAYRNNRRILDKLQLTHEGKRIMGEVDDRPISLEEMPTTAHVNGKLTLDDFLKAVPNLRKEHPELEINVDVKVKNG